MRQHSSPSGHTANEQYLWAWQWFAQNARRRVTWREISSLPHRVACVPKGIYKPAGLGPALSVKQTLDNPYGDSEPTAIGGTWVYQYHEEDGGLDFWTNRAMLDAMTRRWPVGVLRPVSMTMWS